MSEHVFMHMQFNQEQCKVGTNNDSVYTMKPDLVEMQLLNVQYM